MKLCYLINQYPKVSHSFIRREILELEQQGCPVLRVALRGWEQDIVDPLDRTERSSTRYVLRSGAAGLAWAALTAFARPARALQALAATMRLNRHSDKSWLKHLICFVEACQVARWLRHEGIEHLHAHFGTNSAEVAMLASLLSGVPYSFTVHGPEEFDHPAGLCLDQKIRHAALVCAVSSYGRSQLYRWAAIEDWDKIQVVHCGLDAKFMQAPVSENQASATLVCVGRLCEQKGQLLLLDALRIVVDQGHECHVVLAGDGEMRGQIEQRAQALGLAARVSITGWVDSERVATEILAARALVLPSFAEGLPVVLMEALALGRPVISTYVAGIPELVLPGRSGWLVAPGDVAGLAQAMIECLGCEAPALDRMGESGRQRVRERHDVRQEVARLAGYLMKSHSPGSSRA